MKSKLTLRIDDDVKEAAKRLARARGESLSGMVEAYFRLLTEQPSADKSDRKDASSLSRSHLEELGPVTQRIAGALSETSAHGHTKEEDRRATAEAAFRKHG